MKRERARFFEQRFEVFFFRQFARNPGKVQLATGQCLAEFVMHFSRDPRSFLLPDRLQINRQLTQALVRFAKLLLRAAMLGPFLRFSNCPVHRRHKSAEPRFKHIIGRAAFQCFNRDFFSHSSRHKNEGRVRALFPRNFQRSVTIETRQGIIRENQGRGMFLQLFNVVIPRLDPGCGKMNATFAQRKFRQFSIRSIIFEHQYMNVTLHMGPDS